MPSASPSSSADAAPGFSISTDSAKLDVAWIVHSVLGSYWGLHLVGAQIRVALDRSLVFGAYLGQHPAQQGYSLAELLNHATKGDGRLIGSGQQIAFVRCVTDGAIFSSVCDVFVEESHRNKGVGSALMREVVAHPSIAGTICILAARPTAFMWYEKFGFVLVDRKSGIMQREPQG